MLLEIADGESKTFCNKIRELSYMKTEILDVPILDTRGVCGVIIKTFLDGLMIYINSLGLEEKEYRPHITCVLEKATMTGRSG